MVMKADLIYYKNSKQKKHCYHLNALVSGGEVKKNCKLTLQVLQFD